MKKLFLLVLLIIFNIELAFSQNTEKEKQSTIGFGLGASFSGYREETVLDINRYINTITFFIDGAKEKKRLLHSYNFGFFRGKNDVTVAYPVYEWELKPDIFGWFFNYYQSEDTFTRLDFEYSLDYRLWGNKTFPGYLGGAIRTDIYLIETLVNPIYINFTGLISFNIHVGQKWIINEKNILSATVSFPFIGFGIRPQYIGLAGWPIEAGLISLHNYWSVFGNIKYMYKFNSLVSLYSGLGLEFSRVDFPRPRRDAATKIKLGVAFTF